MAWSSKKVAWVVGGVVLGGGACFLTAGLAAPAIGAAIGSGMGFSGVVATNVGLAALGGGALAAGGAGVAGGAALVAAILTTAGALLGGLGMGTFANFFEDTQKEFEDAVWVQKNYEKAQKIILKQEAKIRVLHNVLSREKAKSSADRTKIMQLQKALIELEKLVRSNKNNLRQEAEWN